MATRQELGQQKDQQQEDIARRAVAEVESYVERMEKQAEGASLGVRPAPAADDGAIRPVQDDLGKIVMQAAKSQKQDITLPLTEEETRDGLHHKLVDAVRWVATFCVYMIKKYPGRVFYKVDK